MAIKRRERGEAEINVSSFADIAFLLIIFFILSTTLVQTRGAKLDIPSGQEDASEASDQWPTVSLTEDTITWGERGEPVTQPQLRERLDDLDLLAKEEDQRIVILNTAPEVPFQRYFKVVLAIRDAGGVLAIVDREDDDAEGGAP